MKRLLLSLVVITFVLLWSSASLPLLRAASPAQATAAPENWTPGALVQIKASVMFVWLRVAASAASGVTATISSGDYLVVTGSAPTWDGVQWWWAVRWGPLRGYVEQNSLTLVIPGPAAAASPTAATSTPASSPTVTATPSTTPTPGPSATWTSGTLLRAKASVIFVWLRSTPSSNGAVIDTVYPSDVLVVSPGATTSAWDGAQWWWAVNRQGKTNIGWVEEKGVELIPAGATAVTGTPTQSGTTTAAATWTLNSVLTVKAGLPFVWMRTAPTSNANVARVLYPGWVVLVANTIPTWDGIQWWWYVYQPSNNVWGWIEQNSLS